MSKKKKVWELPDEERMDEACDLIDQAILGTPSIEDEVNDMLSSIAGSKTPDKSKRTLKEKPTINPMRDFLDPDQFDNEDDYEYNDTDDEVPVINDIFDVVETEDEDEDVVDEVEEEDEATEPFIRRVEFYPTTVLGKYILDDGLTPLTFSDQFVDDSNYECTLENIIHTIKDSDALNINGEESFEESCKMLSLWLGMLVTITRHPSIVMSAEDFHDYFQSYKEIDSDIFRIIYSEGYYYLIYRPDETSAEIAAAADRYAKDRCGERGAKYYWQAFIKWYACLVDTCLMKNNICDYRDDDYLVTLREVTNAISFDRDMFYIIDNDESTKKLPLNDIIAESDTEKIENRLNVVTDIYGLMEFGYGILGKLRGWNDDDDDDDDADLSDLSDKIVEAFTERESDDDSSEDNGPEKREPFHETIQINRAPVNQQPQSTDDINNTDDLFDGNEVTYPSDDDIPTAPIQPSSSMSGSTAPLSSNNSDSDVGNITIPARRKESTN